jgi:hypothetical protein
MTKQEKIKQINEYLKNIRNDLYKLNQKLIDDYENDIYDFKQQLMQVKFNDLEE